MNGSPGLLRKMRTRGVRGVCRAVADRIEERLLETYFEWALGIATRGTLSREALGYARPECSDYAPSAYGNIRRILRAIDVRAGEDVFLDFGSGKGRVVIMAARRPFARVIGVERSPLLAEAARRNIERARGRLRCRQVDIVIADAAAYDVPDEATVIYFASPFGGEILDAALERIRASLMRAPRRLVVVSHGYDAANPFELHIRACDWLRVRAEVGLQRSNHAWIHANCRWNSRPAASAV